MRIILGSLSAESRSSHPSSAGAVRLPARKSYIEVSRNTHELTILSSQEL